MSQKRTAFFALLFISVSAYAVSPDEENLNILIQENKAHFQFINVAISNMRSPKLENPTDKNTPPAKEDDDSPDKKMDNPYYNDFLTANLKDFEGTVLHFKGDYKNAQAPLKEAQIKLKEIYESALERHTEFTRVLLIYATHKILKTNDISAKYLLKLAYKELKLAENCYTMGWNNAPYQYRNKISLYESGIRASRKARRFGILALIEQKIPNDQKRLYKKEKFNEFKDSEYDGSVNDYEYLKKTLRNNIENKWVEGKISANYKFERPDTATNFTYIPNKHQPIDLMEMLDDIYGIITYNRISVKEETDKFVRKEITKEELEPSVPGKKEDPKPASSGTPNNSAVPTKAPAPAPVKN